MHLREDGFPAQGLDALRQIGQDQADVDGGAEAAALAAPHTSVSAAVPRSRIFCV
ncbi:hypothetical protein [Streptomyces sp. NPDC002785]|uniref:hypothetical protein n=1 Tax=Streptomyces sp. NPDC002785 TaxID=3154543 RepID=UPI00332EC834